MRYWTVWLSPNAERISLALAHKRLDAERVEVPYDERSEVEAVSGQPYVPVLEHDGAIVTDSERILRYLEQEFPSPPLWPDSPPARAEAEIFIEWFNRVWKRPFNEIHDHLTAEEPDKDEIDGLGRQLTQYVDLFDALLAKRDYLLGDEFGIADVLAFPFLKFPILWVENDPYLYHEILREWMPMLEKRRLQEWIHRVDQRPRV